MWLSWSVTEVRASAGVVGEADRAAVGIGNPGQPAHDVVGKAGDVAQRVGNAGAVAACVVVVGGDVAPRTI